MANVDTGIIQEGPEWLLKKLPPRDLTSHTNVLIVHKVPKIETVSSDVLKKFEKAGVTSREEMEKSAAQHYETLKDITMFLDTPRGFPQPKINYQKVALPEYDAWASQNSMDDIDIVLTVGGDGTVLGASRHIKSTPVISINSDPDKSVGALTRFTRLNWGAAFLHCEAFLLGERNEHEKTFENLWRLEMTHKKQKKIFLNDVLLTNENPAAMSIYSVKWPGHTETQHSSGVWISTAAGSSGGFQSAGGMPCDRNDKALLWKVREPCKVKERPWIVDAWQRGDKIKLRIMAVTPLAAYVDGSHDIIQIGSGETVSFKLSDEPLRLFVDIE